MLANGLSTPQQKKKPFQFRPVRSRAVESAELRQDGRRLFRPARPLRRHRHPDASPPALLWGRESLGCPVVPFVAATTSHHWQQSTLAPHPLPPQTATSPRFFGFTESRPCLSLSKNMDESRREECCCYCTIMDSRLIIPRLVPPTIKIEAAVPGFTARMRTSLKYSLGLRTSGFTARTRRYPSERFACSCVKWFHTKSEFTDENSASQREDF